MTKKSQKDVAQQEVEKEDIMVIETQVEAVEEIQDAVENPEDEAVVDSDPTVEEIAPAKPKKKAAKKTVAAAEPAKPAARDKIVSVTGKKQALTDEDNFRSDLIDITGRSLRSGVILTDVIEGVEEYPNMVAVVLHHGSIKVIIPAEAFRDEYPEYDPSRGYGSRKKMIKTFLDNSIGAEIDYVVKKYDSESEIAIASRLDAMKEIRNTYYRTRKGHTAITAGTRVEGRIIAVIRSGVYAELKGVDTFVPNSELFHTRVFNAANELYVSEEKKVFLVTSVEEEGEGKYKVSASLKQCSENPMYKTYGQLMEQSVYGGKCTMFTTYGIYVTLTNGAQILCAYPNKGQTPVMNSQVKVKISNVNVKKLEAYGYITRVDRVLAGV